MPTKKIVVSTNLLRRVIRQRNALRAQLKEIKKYAESSMGDWVCVIPPHLPPAETVLFDIIQLCEEK